MLMGTAAELEITAMILAGYFVKRFGKRLMVLIDVGTGMLWFQNLVPGRAGSATTLFTNNISTGVILVGVSWRKVSGMARSLGDRGAIAGDAAAY